MGETRQQSLKRHHDEVTRGKAMHMFVAQKMKLGEICRELNLPVSTVSAWFQRIPKTNIRGRRRTDVMPVEKPMGREELLDKYFATLDPSFLRRAVTAQTITSGSVHQNDEDDEE
jgi:hypothetical protein